MAFTMKLSAPLLLVLFISYYPVFGDSDSSSSGSSEEEESQFSADPRVPESQGTTGAQPSVNTASANFVDPMVLVNQGTSSTSAQLLPSVDTASANSVDPMVFVNQATSSTGAQPLPSVDTSAAKLNLFNLISSGQPVAPEADEEEESATLQPNSMMPKLLTTSAPVEEEEEEGRVTGQTTQTPLPEINVLQPIELPIPRVPLPSPYIPPGPIPVTASGLSYQSVQQSSPGIISISSPPEPVGNLVGSGPMAPLLPIAALMPTRPVTQTPSSDDIYCIMSTGDCIPTNSVCIGVVLDTFCSDPLKSCCIPLVSKRAFGL